MTKPRSSEFTQVPNSLEENNIAEWIPPGASKPTQVHLIFTVEDIKAMFVIRFKGTDTLDQIIGALMFHRNEVFGAAGPRRKEKKRMDCKILELRDGDEFVPAIAISCQSSESWLLTQGGLGAASSDEANVILIRLPDVTAQREPAGWPEDSPRLLKLAHQHLRENWDLVVDGGMVDVGALVGDKDAAASIKPTSDTPPAA